MTLTIVSYHFMYIWKQNVNLNFEAVVFGTLH